MLYCSKPRVESAWSKPCVCCRNSQIRIFNGFSFLITPDGCPMFLRISCRAWWRWRTSCGFPYRKPHTRTWLMQRAGNPVAPAYMGRKRIFSNAFTPRVTRIFPFRKGLFARIAERWKGCARFFRPMYAGANMGHPSGAVRKLNPLDSFTSLIWTSLTFRCPARASCRCGSL
jgi:hypothetical protein